MIPGIVASQMRQAVTPASDPYWSSVVSLLHFDGDEGSTVFADETAREWVGIGGCTIATDASAFGGRAMAVPATDAQIATPSTAQDQLGGGDFTLEGWYTPLSFPPAGGFRGIACKDDTTATRGWLLTLNSNAGNAFRFAMFSGTTPYTVTATASATLGARVHLAVSRNGPTLRLFVDGVLQEEKDVTGVVVNANDHDLVYGALVAGGLPAPQWSANGNMDEWRLTVGVGRYEAAFTPAGPFPNN